MEAFKKRLFTAINLPRDLKDELKNLLNELKKREPSVKWVKPDGFHLTLHFLGYLDESEEERAKKAMSGFAGKFGELEFELGKISAFPDINRPRVIFLECRQVNGDTSVKLQKELGEALRKNSIIIDGRPWASHITLGRVKDDGRFGRTNPIACGLKNFSELFGAASKKRFKVNSFELMESKLSQGGAEYKIVKSYAL